MSKTTPVELTVEEIDAIMFPHLREGQYRRHFAELLPRLRAARDVLDPNRESSWVRPQVQSLRPSKRPPGTARAVTPSSSTEKTGSADRPT